MGNLLRDAFRAIWFSPEARHFKQKEYAPAECANCASFRACQAACPLYWSRAGTAEIRNPSSAGRQDALAGAAMPESAAAPVPSAVRATSAGR